ncbi:unnamed protein product, partial [Iphiclides podalirius]
MTHIRKRSRRKCAAGAKGDAENFVLGSGVPARERTHTRARNRRIDTGYIQLERDGDRRARAPERERASKVTLMAAVIRLVLGASV